MPDALTAYHARQQRLAALEQRYAPRLRTALLRSLNPCLALVEAGASPELAAARVSSHEVTQVLAALYVACGTVEAHLTYDELTPATKALAPPAVAKSWAERLRAFITGEGAAAVRGITATTRKLVRAALRESAALGEGIPAAAKRLRAQVGGLARERAVLIARTELLSASNAASLMGAEATGLKLEKVWLATPDGRTRPSHLAANGQGAPLQAGFFTVGGVHCRYPGDVLLPAGERCRCRCAITYRKVL